MARIIDCEYDSSEQLIGVTVEDDGDICEMERVRHAKWISLGRVFPTDNYTYTISALYMCSECGLRATNRHPYCHCGCRMDIGEVNG